MSKMIKIEVDVCVNCPKCKFHQIFDNETEVYVCEERWDSIDNVFTTIDKDCPLEDSTC